jgi:hypothetical protein
MREKHHGPVLARDAFTRGKAPSFFVMNGHDLTMILGEVIIGTPALGAAISM